MICHWCKGTYEECGCGEGYCSHCNHGVVTDPPFEPKEYLNIDYTTLLEEASATACNFDIVKMCRKASEAYTGKMVLSDEDVAKFVGYWEDHYRDETIGEVQWRIEQRVKQRIIESSQNV